MRINAALDVNVVAHEATDKVAVLVDLQAPEHAGSAQRAPTTLQVVLDRSGSMAGEPLESVKRALVGLVQRLEATDTFGVVAFDDQAEVVVPTGPLTDRAAVIARIHGVEPGGMTDLSAGYLRALREVRRASAGRSATGASTTVLVLSDGHANSGIADPGRFAEVTAHAYRDGVVTSTLGYGTGYDETLLSAIARAGSGNHVFAADPDAAGGLIAREVDGLLDKVVQAATVTVRFGPAVRLLRLYNDLPANQVGNGAVMIELGDLYAGEARKLLLRLEVPAMAALGLAQVAALDLQYVELPALIEQQVTLPITVNVVPGDESAHRVADPAVTSEVLFQEAQEAKRQASEAFERGDLLAGRAKLREADEQLGIAAGVAPDASEILREREEVHRMAGLTEDTRYLSKLSRESYHRQNRKRGRTDREES